MRRNHEEQHDHTMANRRKPSDCETSLTPGQELGLRLRAIRKQKRMTLLEVEAQSFGRWKSVVVGSYERGDRAITAINLEKLAAFYAVPISLLYPTPISATPQTISQRPLVDLPILRSALSENLIPLKRFVLGIERSRNDWNGQILSLRRGDIALLGMLAALPTREYVSFCVRNGVMHLADSDN